MRVQVGGPGACQVAGLGTQKGTYWVIAPATSHMAVVPGRRKMGRPGTRQLGSWARHPARSLLDKQVADSMVVGSGEQRLWLGSSLQFPYPHQETEQQQKLQCCAWPHKRKDLHPCLHFPRSKSH